MMKDRKATIAEAVLELLATAGARGVTHRAVDTLAGLPSGSTSSCCRSRLDLLALALNHHAARNIEDLQRDAERFAASPSLERLVNALADRVTDWMSAAKRPRMVAQIEIFLIASREPSLQEVVDNLHQRFLDMAVAALMQLGIEQPKSVATGLIATVDGILLGQIVNSHMRLTRSECRAILSRVVGVA